jgi:hypothetical protein
MWAFDIEAGFYLSGYFWTRHGETTLPEDNLSRENCSPPAYDAIGSVAMADGLGVKS